MKKEKIPEQADLLCEAKSRKLCFSLLEFLKLFEKVQRKFHPLMIPKHGEALTRKAAGLEDAMEDFSPEGRELIQHSGREFFCRLSRSSGLKGCDMCGTLLRSSALAIKAVSRFNASDDLQAGIINAMQAGRTICRVRELLFELRSDIGEIDEYFREKNLECRGQKKETQECPGPEEQIIHITEGQARYERGIPSIYLPGVAKEKKRLPVVVALHGGLGHGRDFIWTWIREARCRRIFLLAPTSIGSTWSLENTGTDLLPLIDLLKRLAREYPLDLNRILLTGLSDGATFALQCSLLKETPFHAFSPVCGVLPPGDLAHVRSRRIYWVHGAHDWMFPPARARAGSEALEKAGADITLKVIDDLAHAYPSEENSAILTWFDSAFFPEDSGLHP